MSLRPSLSTISSHIPSRTRQITQTLLQELRLALQNPQLLEASFEIPDFALPTNSNLSSPTLSISDPFDSLLRLSPQPDSRANSPELTPPTNLSTSAVSHILPMAQQQYFMPVRGATSAPSFDGKSENLNRFFEDVEDHADRAQLNDAARIKWCLRYTNPTDAETWGLLPARQTNVYADFKAEVLQLYPGLDSDRRYTVSDLERLVDEYRTKRISSKDILGEYHRDFMRISVFLIGKSRISERERNRWYLQGFHYELRDRISQRLAIVKSDINPDDSYDYLEIHKSAVFILNCSTVDLAHAYSVAPVPSNPTPSPSQTPQTTTVVKTETRDNEVLRQIQLQLSALTQAIASSSVQSSPAQTSPQQQTASPNSSNNVANAVAHLRPGQAVIGSSVGFCLFCGGPVGDHLMRNCPVAEQYIREGKCARNAEGRIALPNGDDIPRGLRGRWLRERLDSYHEVFGGLAKRDTPPHITAALYEIFPDTEIMQMEVSRIEEIDEDPDLARVAILQAELKKVEEKLQEKKKFKKAVRFDGVDVPPPPTWAKGKGPATANKAKHPPMVPISTPDEPPPAKQHTTSSTSPSSSSDNKSASTSPSSSTKPDTSPYAPQYRYQAAIEDPSVSRALLERALDAPIQTTARELLATSPDLRKQFKEMVMSRRVSADAVLVESTYPVQTVESFLNEHGSKYTFDPIVAEHSVPLRIVFPEFANGVRPECILDSGAQIIAMRKDVWKQMDLPLMCEKIMVMESANNSRNATLGVVQNVRVEFGPIALHLQVQIVDNAPFEVLLGLPFYCLANVVSEHFQNGDANITLRDPNTHVRATFPTHTRLPKPPRLPISHNHSHDHSHDHPRSSNSGFP